jgi:hypothetical protein
LGCSTIDDDGGEGDAQWVQEEMTGNVKSHVVSDGSLYLLILTYVRIENSGLLPVGIYETAQQKCGGRFASQCKPGGLDGDAPQWRSPSYTK